MRDSFIDFTIGVGFMIAVFFICMLIFGCADDCDNGQYSCHGTTIVHCVDQVWEDDRECDDVLTFDLETIQMQCCPVRGDVETMECRESCE